MLTVPRIRPPHRATDQPNGHREPRPKGNKRYRRNRCRSAGVIYRMLAAAARTTWPVARRRDAEMASSTYNDNSRCIPLDRPSTWDVIYAHKHKRRQFFHAVPNTEPLLDWQKITIRRATT